ncbi:hypothetical protein CesoFtcFv8_006026 [Champsocephalus esox]|uniref:Uncharacterized protein n=1 Tax=Champsocephalus esox TaxID=159716 RepID=A0AAN8CIF0_9TELE|nr:hypothetical protein CesoFtcFv8_006026 [Champsocephalus esox]
MDKDGKRQKECERREDFGSGEVTQLPDHVIAERRGQNAAEEESMHIRQRKRTRKRRKGRKKDKRRQETREVSLKASRSCRRAEHRIEEKKTKQRRDLCPSSRKHQEESRLSLRRKEQVLLSGLHRLA